MNKSRRILKAFGFVMCTVLIAGLFSAFAAWAMASLDPAVQEVIGNVNSPWIAAPRSVAPIRLDATMVVRRAPDFDRPSATGASAR